MAYGPSSGMPKRILEAPTEGQRAIDRKRLGSLRNLTVQPATKERYRKAVSGFLAFLRQENLVLPTLRSQLDPILCEYVEHLWASGKGRALACDTLAGLQDRDPKFKGHLQGAWRLLKTWQVNEIPARAPPLPEHVLLSMVGWSFFHQQFSFGVSLLLGFYGMLRTGELLGLKGRHIQLGAEEQKLLISLGFTKAGKRVGAAESTVIGHNIPVHFALCWKKLAAATTSLTPSPAKWRGLFNQALEALQLSEFRFRPYSLRRGGATWWFSKHQSLDKILVQGRWQAAKTARLYINEGLSVLAELSIPPIDPRIFTFLSFFHKNQGLSRFTTLEPLPKGRRSGGRGKASKNASRPRQTNVRGEGKSFFSAICFGQQEFFP